MILSIKALKLPKLKDMQLTSPALLTRLAEAGKLPAPHFSHEVSGHAGKNRHFCRVEFRVPLFLKANVKTVTGAGQALKKAHARALAALEAQNRLQRAMGLPEDGLQLLLEDYEAKQSKEHQEIEKAPIDKEVPGVSWAQPPHDPEFAVPHSRTGRIEFNGGLKGQALTAAKVATMASTAHMPLVQVHESTHGEGMIRVSRRIFVCSVHLRVVLF